MPFKDPEARKNYDKRRYQRLKSGVERPYPENPLDPTEWEILQKAAWCQGWAKPDILGSVFMTAWWHMVFPA